MKSPLSTGPKSVRTSSESIRRELSQLILHLEETTRGVDDARFRKLAMKSTEVVKGLRSLFERLGSEEPTPPAKAPQPIGREAKTGGASPAVAGEKKPNKTDPRSAAPAKRNGSFTAAEKTGAAVSSHKQTKVGATAGKPAAPTVAPGPLAPTTPDAIAAVAKPLDPDEIAAKARLQRQEARAPKRPGGHAAPKPMPPQSGKPIWSKPHSS